MSPRAAFESVPPRAKPRFRGVSHQIGFFVALVLGAWLLTFAPDGRSAVACAIYAASLCTLLGVSAVYHRRTWTHARRMLMRRLDHSAIFFLIAGTYTPLFALLDPLPSHRPLWMIWVGAAMGVIKSLLWPNAPKPVTAALYVLLGWAVVGDVARLASTMGPLALILLVAGGVVYSTGALVYARKKPDPWPEVFGYHEIFHAMVLVASVLNFVHVIRVVELYRSLGS